jgi:uncharacterized membrane protein
MNFYKTRAQLKASAKDKLVGKYSSAVSIVLLAQLLQLVAQEVSAWIPNNTVPGFILNLVVMFVILSITGVLQLGLNLFFLSMACGSSFQVSQLFYGFKEQSNKAFMISAVFGLLQLLCLVPGQLCAQFYLITFQSQYLIRGLWLMGIGIIIYIPVSLMLSQSFYIMLDFPDMNARETLKYSMKLMKGHKKQLFLLECSFIPLMLLCLLTLGIGLLWLMPYMAMAETLFFLDLMHPSASTSNTR